MPVRVHLRLECDMDDCRNILDAYADEGSTITSVDAEDKGWRCNSVVVYCPLHREEWDKIGLPV